jgi:hypothetical protein|tara:strand:+ start:975 stop:1136 length:162 start_codon:yes stop_codon:yes gene_type:complete
VEGDVVAQYLDLGMTMGFIGYLINQNRRMGRQLTKMTRKYEELFERVLKRECE